MTRTTTPARTRRPAAKVAASWDALAAALGVDIRRMYRLKLEGGAPTSRDIEAWRTFIAAREKSGAGMEPQRSVAQLEREQADLRYARARAEQAEREASLAAGRMVTREQASSAAALVRDAFHAEGDVLPSAVIARLPQLGKTDRDAVEAAVRQAWIEARTRVAKGVQR